MRDRVEIVQADITQQNVDAIINAANTSLLGGGGVDGAIHRTAGPGLVQECRRLNGCPTGGAKLTAGYHLPARHVIHAVGPIWRDGTQGEAELLAKAYRNCFSLIREHALTSAAFPSISTGAYRFPIDQACRIALTESSRALRPPPFCDDLSSSASMRPPEPPTGTLSQISCPSTDRPGATACCLTSK